MFRRDDWSNQSRFPGKSCFAGMGIALLLSVGSVTVAAQTAFDFEDPLDDLRAKIELQASEAEKNAAAEGVSPTEAASNWAANATRAADDAVAGVSSDVKANATSLAERLGLPVNGLLGLAVLGALALGLGLFWLLSRRRPAAKKRNVKRKDRDLYAVANGSRARRSLESGSKVTRHRTQTLDTGEGASGSAAAAAAKVLSDERIEDDDLERAYSAVPEETDESYVPEDENFVPETALVDVAEVKADDPSTWRRPNLDRLKASIRDDWKGTEPERSDPTPLSPLEDEAKTFAELFGDDDASMDTRGEAKSPVLDMLQETPDDPLPSALRSVLESKKDPQSALRKPRVPASSRAEAVRRIKALRESVRAG